MKRYALKMPITLLIFSLIILFEVKPVSKAYASSEDYIVKPEVFRYEEDATIPVNAILPENISSIASIQLSGNINNETEYENCQAYGIESGNVTFSLIYDGTFLDETKDTYLIDDNGKKANGKDIGSKIKKGVLIIQKSRDGKSWEDIANPVINIFADNPQGISALYTTNGEDVKKGCYYRVTLEYKIKTKVNSKRILIWNKENFEEYKYVEKSVFYICLNNAEITIHNLSVKNSDIKALNDEYSIEVLKKGETLVDGSAAKNGFAIDTNGAAYTVKVNDKIVSNGKSFTKDGRYVISTTSKLGVTKTKTIYVFSGGDDQGFSKYFDKNIVLGKRVFRDGEYPTYAAGSVAYIKTLAVNVPQISGTITNISTGDVIKILGERTEQKIKLSEGTYCAELYTGNTDVGSVFHYTFHFNIIGEDAKPYVNYNKLMNSNRLSDMASKNYQVVYPTTGGGYIYVCFSSYDEAFAYAYEIEKRFIERLDGKLYYKLEENPNKKIAYAIDTNEDKIKLTKTINYYARQNVEVSYINPLERYTYKTVADDNADLLRSLEDISTKESIKVFSSEEEKEKALSRVPYLNNYKFMHVDDYDVKSVEALCKANGEKYPINFDDEVDKQLLVSSEYTIIETNEYGDELSYDVTYMGENQTVSTWEKIYNGETSKINVSSNENEPVNADVFSLRTIANNLDNWAIMTISAPDSYSYNITGLLPEMKNLTLYKKGNYKITFIDRVGNAYELDVYITGDINYEHAITGDNKSYTDIYNSIYINDKDGSEEIR